MCAVLRLFQNSHFSSGIDFFKTHKTWLENALFLEVKAFGHNRPKLGIYKKIVAKRNAIKVEKRRKIVIEAQTKLETHAQCYAFFKLVIFFLGSRLLQNS